MYEETEKISLCAKIPQLLLEVITAMYSAKDQPHREKHTSIQFNHANDTTYINNMFSHDAFNSIFKCNSTSVSINCKNSSFTSDVNEVTRYDPFINLSKNSKNNFILVLSQVNGVYRCNNVKKGCKATCFISWNVTLHFLWISILL